MPRGLSRKLLTHSRRALVKGAASVTVTTSQFRIGPIPNYSTAMSNGTRVSCAGCCLTIPSGCLTSAAAVAAP